MLRQLYCICNKNPKMQSSIEQIFSLRKIVFALLVFCSLLAKSQSDYFFKSPDGEIAIEVSRQQQTVTIALFLTNATQFESVSIERSLDAQNNFAQCKYIRFNESAQANVVIVKKDEFPLTSIGDIFYRIKTISTEGVTRIYPSVRLPNIREANLY